MERVGNRPSRATISLPAKMRVGDDFVEVTIVNCSETGLLVRCDEPPAAETEVEIKRRGTTILGTVIWAAGRRFGVRAEKTIEISTLTAKSELQPDRRLQERPPTSRRLRARWMFWNPPL